MKARPDDDVRVAGFVGDMVLAPVQVATFGTLAASGISTMSQVGCTVPLTGPVTDGGRACPGWIRGLPGLGYGRYPVRVRSGSASPGPLASADLPDSGRASPKRSSPSE